VRWTYIPFILAAVLALQFCGDNTSGGGGQPCTPGNGPANSANCPTPTPPPTNTPVAAPPLVHVPNFSDVGQFIAGSSGNVTNPQIQANVTIAFGQTQTAPDRAVLVCDHGVHCSAASYFDFMRLDTSSPIGQGHAFLNDPGYSETNPHPWLLHQGTQTVGGRTSPKTNLFNTNFGEPQTSAWWLLCFQGHQVSCSGTVGGSDTFNDGDYIYSDTSHGQLCNLIYANPAGLCPASTIELANDAAYQAALLTWFPAAGVHSNLSPYLFILNGFSTGESKTENGQASCVYTDTCLAMLAPTNVYGGDIEFCGQNQLSIGGKLRLVYKPSFFPFCVNSATNIIWFGKTAFETEEYEAATYTCPGNQIGANPATMMAYEGVYLLTYNPVNPTSEYSKLQVQCHATGQTSNHLNSWPVQQIVPTGSVAIAVTPYAQSGGGGPYFGLAGCTPGQNDSGGIQVYLVSAASCGNAGDGTNVGVYSNAFSNCNLAGSAMPNPGPCAVFVNLTQNAYNTSLCANVTALGADLSLTWSSATFGHQVDIGQVSATFGDVIPSGQGGGGGTITTNSVTWACGSPNIPANSAVIATP
jgi:hypothetical protein